MTLQGGKVGNSSSDLPINELENEQEASKPLEVQVIQPSGNLIDDIFEAFISGAGASSGTVGRREFICQEGRIYARIRLGSGKKRTKENGGYIYKGHISKYKGDPRWERRIFEYATSHKCHYPHPDLERTGNGISDTGNGLSRPSGNGGEVAHVALPFEVWENRPAALYPPS